MRQIEARALRCYQEQFGANPTIVASAPGRVNLIGEHTDYNGGFVLPCAIERRVAVALGTGTGTLYSGDFQESQSLSGCKRDGWAAYPRGVAWAFTAASHILPPFDAAYTGDVPIGAGLSSSAAIEAATALALDDFADLHLTRRELALLCQHAENRFVGLNSGIMDQYASLLCEEGAALLIDCRSLQAEGVPSNLAEAGLTLVICDTRVRRKLGETGYNERQATCQRAARRLGLSSLRDATASDLDALHGEEKQRARHVVTENARVLQAVEALRRHDFASLGRLMDASHTSLRDDYEVSTPELDTFVQAARGAGALGARLTGAGFGGCGIALLASTDVPALETRVVRDFADNGFETPVLYQTRPSAGAALVDR